MDKPRNKIQLSLLLIVLIIIVVCLFKKNAMNGDKLDFLNKRIVEIILTNYMDGDIISETDIAVDRIYYGAFSKENANEVLVISKILNTPHAAGLDKTVTVLLAADSLELIAYKEFGADIVELECFQGNNGQKRVVVTYTMIYQGIATQKIGLFAIDKGEWNEVPIEYLETLDGEYYCFISEEFLIVTSQYGFVEPPFDSLIMPVDIIEILVWDPYAEQFIVPKVNPPLFSEVTGKRQNIIS